jgi:hypothetical protein
MNPPNILVIDADAAANRELSTWLLNRPKPPRLFVALEVSAAVDLFRSEPITGLFIRINQWDAFQCLGIPVPQVIFLSGRAEKCTQHLRHLLDAHLPSEPPPQGLEPTHRREIPASNTPNSSPSLLFRQSPRPLRPDLLSRPPLDSRLPRQAPPPDASGGVLRFRDPFRLRRPPADPPCDCQARVVGE